MQRVAQACRLLHKYKQACHNMAFIGAQPPEDHPDIRAEFNKAHENLLKVVEAGLEAKANAKKEKKKATIG